MVVKDLWFPTIALTQCTPSIFDDAGTVLFIWWCCSLVALAIYTGVVDDQFKSVLLAGVPAAADVAAVAVDAKRKVVPCSACQTKLQYTETGATPSAIDVGTI